MSNVPLSRYVPTYEAEADKAFESYVSVAFEGAQVGRVGVQQLRYAFRAGWLRGQVAQRSDVSEIATQGAYALPSTEEVERTMHDAARYRYLKDNRRLLNITIEAFYPGKRTVNGADANGLIDWYMKEYPIHE